MSSISRLRSPVSRSTASRVSSCSASSDLRPRAPTRWSRLPPDERDHRPLTLDVHVDVAVEVGDVEQLLEVVGGDVTLVLQPLEPAIGLRRRPAGRPTVDSSAASASGLGRGVWLSRWSRS